MCNWPKYVALLFMLINIYARLNAVAVIVWYKFIKLYVFENKTPFRNIGPKKDDVSV
jgi:hypothetical protein